MRFARWIEAETGAIHLERLLFLTPTLNITVHLALHKFIKTSYNTVSAKVTNVWYVYNLNFSLFIK